ncbi:MAG: hypothetical protein LW847_10550 [Burkholderiales bacterium]|nr:hypothetical protein [Burkholderiales bacterium]
MEHPIQLQIEKLPEGVYLATRVELRSLLVRGRTIQETIEIARAGRDAPPLAPAGESFDDPLVVAAWWVGSPASAIGRASRARVPSACGFTGRPAALTNTGNGAPQSDF